jgi:hypothetical protein
MKTLSHFSSQIPKIDFGKKYPLPDELDFKPKGLWLSDESAYGWKKWCKKEDFHLENLKYETQFKITDFEKVLWLKNDEEIENFHKKYSCLIFNTLQAINWEKVQSEYSGLLISPYSWKFRLEFSWYYGWDCASACIWDLSALF